MSITFYLAILLFSLALLFAHYALKREMDTHKSRLSPAKIKAAMAGIFFLSLLLFGVYGAYEYQRVLDQEKERWQERLQGIEHLFASEFERLDGSLFDVKNPKRHDSLGRLALYIINSAQVSQVCLADKNRPLQVYILNRKSNYAGSFHECVSSQETGLGGWGALIAEPLRAAWSEEITLENRFDKVEARFFIDTRSLEVALEDFFSALGNLILVVSTSIFAFAFGVAIYRGQHEEGVKGFSESRAFEKLIHTIPMPILYKDMNGVCLGCNERFLEATAKSREEILGKRTIEWLDKKAAMEIEECEKRLKRAGQIEEHEASLVDINGVEHQVKIYKTLLTNNFDEPVGVMGFLFDITEYRQLQKELKDRQEQLEFFSEQLEKQMEYEILGRLNSERRYKQLFDSSRDGIFVIASDEEKNLKVIEANESAKRLLEGVDGVLAGADFIALMEEENRDSLRKILEEIPLQGGALAEGRFLLPCGGKLPIELSIQSFLLENQNTLYVAARDITERLRLEEEKQAQENMLIQQSKMATMGEMIGAIAHQWKQPLNVIYLLCQGLRESFIYEELDEAEMERFVSGMMKQVEFMSHTITDFRNFFMPSKQACGFALKEALQDMYQILQPQFVKCDIEVRIVQQSEGSIIAYGYPNEFKQVALNIMNNARDAIETRLGKGEKFSGRIDIEISEEVDSARVRIKDNGGGIPSEVLKTIFQPYVSTKGEKGTGIGLSIAKTIIEKNMKGEILAYNEDEGAVFEMRIPLESSLPPPASLA